MIIYYTRFTDNCNPIFLTADVNCSTPTQPVSKSLQALSTIVPNVPNNDHLLTDTANNERCQLFLTADKTIDYSAKHTANDRGHPEQPKLCNRPIAYEERNTSAARRIYGSICYRDAN
ncbi:hypothetical protein DespoDRAFT_02288 [Desulfobacter postgatei 2ac9]|uniref:Uncharacterized protein n=1 Tax=Desulfobacter postgatei 2ac9 TaxID=879212 RepID=I5B3U8_9BACT|nr:hypothetical protein DespoDRAFT_02288 [Desulfobacter postgatei 2ac9]